MLSFDFSPEQRMYRQAVRDFAEKELAPLVDEAERTETLTDRSPTTCWSLPTRTRRRASPRKSDCRMVDQTGAPAGACATTLAAGISLLTPTPTRTAPSARAHPRSGSTRCPRCG